MIRTLFPCVVFLALLACGAPDIRFGSPQSVAPVENVSVRFARIEVLDVSLPSYAESEEIFVRDATGAIAPLGPLWSDAPSRGATLELVRTLGEATGRLVAPAPWPFRDPSDVRVDVRLDAFLATETGTFRVSGQVFVAPEDALGRDNARSFEIETVVSDSTDAAAISAARSAALRQLAVFIARNGLR